jgi:hypothetical protein
LFDSISITEEDAKRYYSENPERFQGLDGADFNHVRDDVVQKLYRDKQKELLNEYITKLKQKAHIVYPAGEK